MAWAEHSAFFFTASGGCPLRYLHFRFCWLRPEKPLGFLIHDLSPFATWWRRIILLWSFVVAIFLPPLVCWQSETRPQPVDWLCNALDGAISVLLMLNTFAQLNTTHEKNGVRNTTSKQIILWCVQPGHCREL